MFRFLGRKIAVEDGRRVNRVKKTILFEIVLQAILDTTDVKPFLTLKTAQGGVLPPSRAAAIPWPCSTRRAAMNNT